MDFGWASEVSSLFAEKKRIHVRRIGAKDAVIPSAKKAELAMLPSLDQIIDIVREEVAI